MRIILKVVCALLGSAVAFSIVYVAVGLATSGAWPYYDQQPNLLMVMGLLFGAVGGWQAAPSPEAVFTSLKSIPSLVAKYVAALVPWAMVVFVLVYSLDWFGGYESWTSNSDFKRVLVFLLIPPASLSVAISLMTLAWSKQESVQPQPSHAWLPTEPPKESQEIVQPQLAPMWVPPKERQESVQPPPVPLWVPTEPPKENSA